MKRKLLLGGIGALTIVFMVAVMVYIQRSFVFNPLTFKQDNVTYAQWREYKYPLQVEYLIDDRGWKLYKVADKDEVKFVFSQLKKAKALADDEAIARQNGKRTVVVIRKVFSPEKNTVLVLLDSSEGSRVATLRTTAYHRILLPEEFSGLIAERLKEAEKVE